MLTRLEVRGVCSFYWYWWNCWPSQFILSFHNFKFITEFHKKYRRTLENPSFDTWKFYPGDLFKPFFELTWHLSLKYKQQQYSKLIFISINMLNHLEKIYWETNTDRIISLRKGVLAYKTRLSLPLVIEVPVPGQESEWSCIDVVRTLLFTLSTMLLLYFGTFPTVWYFFVFNFIEY